MSRRKRFEPRTHRRDRPPSSPAGGWDVDSLVAWLRREEQSYLRWKWLTPVWCFAVCAPLTWLAIVELGIPVGLGIVLGAVVCALYVYAAAVAPSADQKDGAQRLAHLEDLRAVGPLLEALDWPGPVLEAEVVPALLRLLPRLKASDYNLLDSHQRDCLYRTLAQPQPSLALCALQAIEQVGDVNAIPHIERVLDRDGSAARSAVVRSAASVCLEALRERIERDRIAHTLLHPAAAPTDASQSLLRPAHDTPEAEAELLLRPSVAEEGPRP